MRSSVITHSKKPTSGGAAEGLSYTWAENIQLFILHWHLQKQQDGSFFLSVSVCGWGIWVGQMMTCSLECSKPERQYYISLHKTVRTLFFGLFGSMWHLFTQLMLILSRLRKNQTAVLYLFLPTVGNQCKCTDFFCCGGKHFIAPNLQMILCVIQQYHADILQQWLKWKGYFWATWETCSGRSSWVLSLQIQRADISEAVITSRTFAPEPSVLDSGRAQPKIRQNDLRK